MIARVLPSVLVLLSVAAPAVAQQEPLWETGVEDGAFQFVDAAAKGGLVVAGGFENLEGVLDRAAIAAFDAVTGEVQWLEHGDTATAVNGGASGEAWLAPVLVRKGVVVAGGGREVDGGNEGALRAYDQQDGTLLWSRTFADSSFTRIALAGKAVIVGCSLHDDDETSLLLQAHELFTGDLLWSETYGPIEDQLVFADVVAGPRQAALVASQSGPDDFDVLVVVHDARTGEFLWDDVYDAGGGSDAATQAAVQGRRLFVGGWQMPEGGDVDGLLRAYDLKDGTPLWTHSPALQGEQFVNALEPAGASVVTLSSGTDGVLRSHRTKTGVPRWDAVLDVDEPEIADGLAVRGSRIVFAALDATHARDAATGESAWESERGGSGVAILGKRAFVPGNDGAVAYPLK